LTESITSARPGFGYNSSLAQRYDRAAKKWHKTLLNNGYLDAYADLIRASLAELPVLKNSTALSVLDAGAGTGGFSLVFCETVMGSKSVDLLDISKNMLEIAAGNHRLRGQPTQGICAAIHDLEPGTKRYDVILCAHVIEHCANPVDALTSLHALLAPGGVLILSMSKPHWCTAILRLLWGHKAWAATAATNMLNKAGFSEPDVHPFKSGPPKFTSLGYIARSKHP
jgi:2-polyprenyl-3-methyl-5-hydroxy-6-metoxy-1,4-benzoquinol methylase